MTFEPVITIGWREASSGKGAPIQVYYTGADVEAAAAAAEAALNSGQATYTRVVRGAFPGSSQLMAASGPTHRWQPPGPVLPAGS